MAWLHPQTLSAGVRTALRGAVGVRELQWVVLLTLHRQVRGESPTPPREDSRLPLPQSTRSWQAEQVGWGRVTQQSKANRLARASGACPSWTDHQDLSKWNHLTQNFPAQHGLLPGHPPRQPRTRVLGVSPAGRRLGWSAHLTALLRRRREKVGRLRCQV